MSEAEVAATAIGVALADAGLTPADVDGLCLYDIESTTIGDAAAVLGLDHLRFFSTHSHGGGSYCAVVLHAAAALAAGHASVVVAFRARNRGRGSSYGKSAHQGGRPWEKIAPRISGFYQWQVPFGVVSPVQEMAMIARRHMLDRATGGDPLGEGACAPRTPAARNPHALRGEPMTPAATHPSRFVAE